MLRKKYDSQDDIPDYARGLYEERDGAFHLRDDIQIEGAAPPASGGNDDRLAEFRDRNRALNQQLERMKSEMGQLRSQFEGIDPEAVKKFQERIGEIEEEEERKLIQAGNIDEVVQRRTARMLDDKNKEVKQAREAYSELKSQHEKLVGNYTSMQALDKVTRMIDERNLRVRSGAKLDLADRIRADWTTDADGNLVPKRKDLMAEDGSPIKPEEYVQHELLDRRSFFFEPARGGGSGGNDAPESKDDQKGLVARDPVAIGKNMEAIAKGEKRVAQD